MVSSAVLSAWAKSDRAGGSLSLFRHSADSSAVAGLVWDHWLPQHVRSLLADGLPGELLDARVLFCWLAGLHDVGKLTPCFACQVPELFAVMHDHGLPAAGVPVDRKVLPHGLAGQIAVEEFLVGLGWSKRVAATYAVVIGSHHGVPPTVGQIQAAKTGGRSLWGGQQWADARRELIELVTGRSGAADRVAEWAAVRLSTTQQVLWTAAVIVTDWIASNQDLFPLDSERASSIEAAKAWKLLGLPAAWSPAGAATESTAARQELFRSRFARDDPMRPLQEECLRIACELPEPGLLIVEAPMGEGKTEAALLAAEVLAERFGAGGVFVALPTMATSDAMFARVREWVEEVSGRPGSMVLAHGKAALNEEYAQLKRQSFVDIGSDCDDGAVLAHGWFVGKKGPLANFVVGTIDQVLRGALKSRHVMLRHLGLANKVVVIDEVHAADNYMSTYLCRVLEWLGAYRVPVMLLSATLPPAQRAALLEAYARGRPTVPEAVDTGSVGYPAVSVWPHAGLSCAVPPSGRSIDGIEVDFIDDDAEALTSRLAEVLTEGGTVGVVCNTVARAQHLFDVMTAPGGFDAGEVLLLHSRFVSVDRARYESRLRRLLGPPATGDRPQRLVVIGTQVIEQSLDIDVDLLVTDLAPVDLILQRIGRLHRHLRSGRPARVSRPRCWVRGADWASVPPKLDKGCEKVYGRARLLRAAAVLTGRRSSGITVPADIPGLVADAYAERFAVPAGWEEVFAEAEAAWALHVADQRKRAGDYLLGSPHSENPTIRDWLVAGVRDDADGVGGQAQVRDAEDSIEAIVVQRVGEEVRVLPEIPDEGGRVVPTDACPEPRLAKTLAQCTIRLPAFLTRYNRMNTVLRTLEDTFYPGWQQSHWLAGELVLELDEDLSAELAGHLLIYDTTRGLDVAATKETDTQR
ncbi:CRISPR-associated helicase Cas3' [Nocardia amikacinitolerans]|uniref:CRISPR-associated helicase Cas3' n=1 Tax=Nocardia amikacinitolerans TaxID=756689 RepID=UPI0036B9722D